MIAGNSGQFTRLVKTTRYCIFSGSGTVSTPNMQDGHTLYAVWNYSHCDICKNSILHKSMEQTRIIYETLTGKRVSDTHWTKTKKLMSACDLPMDKDGFSVLINLRKISPRYFSKYVEIKDDLTNLGKQLLPTIGDGLTGKQFLELIERLEIHPNQGTVSRWFRSVGGFKSNGNYTKQVILPIVATALIYKSKSQSSKLNKIGA